MFESEIAELFSKKILGSLDIDFNRALLSIYHIWPEMDTEGTQSMLKLDFYYTCRKDTAQKGLKHSACNEDRV